MDVQFVRAESQDFDETIDLANYVFSHNGTAIDFPKLLPKLYKPEYFMDSIHYLAKENGKIKAVVGAYPLEMEFSGSKNSLPHSSAAKLPGRGIGMVSVHPYCRSKGYMKELMKTALEDMKKDGIVFSCLGGQRQRYEYFDFYSCGNSFSFYVNRHNISHSLGRDFKSSLSLVKVNADDFAGLDEIQKLHDTKNIRMHRDRKKLFDVLSSWKNEVYIVKNGAVTEGYLIYNGNDYISEIILNDYSRISEVVFLLQNNRDISIRLNAGSYETEKITALSQFAGYYNQSHSYQFSIFDFLRLSDVLIKQKEIEFSGSFVIQINDEAGNSVQRIRLFSEKDRAGAEETNETPAIILSKAQAINFLFSPLEASINSNIKSSAFLNALLPLPLFIEDADRI